MQTYFDLQDSSIITGVLKVSSRLIPFNALEVLYVTVATPPYLSHTDYMKIIKNKNTYPTLSIVN